MKSLYPFLIFLFIFPVSQVFAEEVRNLGCDPFIQVVGVSTINNRCSYSDNTFSASSINCERIGCCKNYLELLEKGIYTQIGQLSCIDSNGVLKTYINGKDADIPTIITAEKVNIAKTEGDNSPALAGDNSQLLQQNIDIENERKWYEKPLGLILIGIFIAVVAYFLISFLRTILKKDDR